MVDELALKLLLVRIGEAMIFFALLWAVIYSAVKSAMTSLPRKPPAYRPRGEAFDNIVDD